MTASQPRVIRTMCPMSGHPTLRGLLAEVEDGRLIRVTGDKDNPDNQGFLCVRGQAAHEVIEIPYGALISLASQIRHAMTFIHGCKVLKSCEHGG